MGALFVVVLSHSVLDVVVVLVNVTLWGMPYWSILAVVRFSWLACLHLSADLYAVTQHVVVAFVVYVWLLPMYWYPALCMVLSAAHAATHESLVLSIMSLTTCSSALGWLYHQGLRLSLYSMCLCSSLSSSVLVVSLQLSGTLSQDALGGFLQLYATCGFAGLCLHVLGNTDSHGLIEASVVMLCVAVWSGMPPSRIGS